LHPNVLLHLQRIKISFKLHKHEECAFPIKSPKDFAKALGYPLERITKSLFLSAQADGYAVAVCSINKKSDFSRIAEMLGSRRLEVASQDDLKRVMDYPSQGVSPLGVTLPIFVDSHLMSYETILIGAGQPGYELEISPHDLVASTSAAVTNFTLA
jgi:Cys-tRNA(Pro)/Cys-tRNA(Cys) deacylase